ncbi:MAG TPA: alpha-isopropylmalate synthase regulatory domain-containing protein [Kofleriaceae bacterium]|nr:alpha-isopropylmalate synthase regulatory domain-containing protein [Kofleriaceae bacterium]
MTQVPREHQDLIRRVLAANYFELAIERMWIDEIVDGETVVKARVNERAQVAEVEGKGVGVVDALFHALLARYAVEYQSLKTIRLAGFSVSADIDGKETSTDAMGTVTIDVTNSDQRRFTFSDSSRSVTASIARATVAVVQYFINAERAFITLFNARKDALERGRADLVARYTAELSEVVESTSYAEVIESKKRELR